MTLSEIIRNGHGSAGSNRSWKVEARFSDPFVGQEFTLTHYDTVMLIWRHTHRYGNEVLYISTGNGSVSDQGGMNTAFKVLSLPYYFSRAGGAEIIELCQCARFDFPHQHAPACDTLAECESIYSASH